MRWEHSKADFCKQKLESNSRNKMIGLLLEYSYCFAWSYTKMLGLSREQVEHRLPVKPGFRKFKQMPRLFH